MLARVIDGAVWAGCRVPSPVAHALAAAGGHLEWAARPGKRAALAANLGHAVGRAPTDRAVRRLVRREIVNEAHRSADLLWALGRRADFLASLEQVGVEQAQKAVGRGRGLILVGIHLGGWELATAVPAVLFDVPSTAVVADNWLAWAIEDMRARAGLGVVPRTAPIGHIGRLLRRGEVLIVLGDDASGPPPRTHAVRFLDAHADLPSGPATLARVYGSPLAVFTMLPVGRRRWRLTIHPPIEAPGSRRCPGVDEATLQLLADRWTEVIRAAPEHWAASFPIAWRDGDGGQVAGVSESSAIS